MIIVVDNKVTAAEHCLGDVGEVILVDASQIDRGLLLDTRATALVVRTATRVDDRLLAGTAVRFVGTATAGVDHIDTTALARRGITLADAAGANAAAVCEYVLRTIFEHTLHPAPKHGRGERSRGDVDDSRARPLHVGIVGYGHVGRRLSTSLRGMGVTVAICDPPLAEAHRCARGFIDLDAIFRSCNVVSLHVPLTSSGRHPTHHIVDGPRLSSWSIDRPLLINTSRGAVLDTDSLFNRDLRHIALALDVWEGEPDAIRWALLSQPGLRIVRASPHIAGYSMQAKLAATLRIRRQLLRDAGLEKPVYPTSFPTISSRPPPPIEIDLSGIVCAHEATARVLARLCPVEASDRLFRALAQRPPPAQSEGFHRLRPSTPNRIALAGRRVLLRNRRASADLRALLRHFRWLGTKIEDIANHPVQNA
ncbi:MAG: NAD(P)-dependent oxidoreductase [Nannocystaceae bacterium]